MDKNNKTKPTLKMIADGLFSTHESLLACYNSIPRDERDNNSWWYLHGQLEEDVHYDKATTTNCKSAGYSRETINWNEILGTTVTVVSKESLTIHRMHIDGEIPVEVEGISKPCTGFFWTNERDDVTWNGKSYPHWEQRGLVCYSDDTEACDYARKKMQEKSIIL